MKVRVSEIFTAPQGEGPHLGRPSLFVRVHGCPLSCVWCDSSWIWSKQHPDYHNYVEYESTDDLVGAMMAEIQDEQYAPRGLVLTGGEPLIYQSVLPGVIDLYRTRVEELYGTEVAVEVETSGVIVPSKFMLSRCHFNVSHKLPNAGNEKVPVEKLWNRAAVRQFLHPQALGAVFKPVVNAGSRRQLFAYLQFLAGAAAGLVSAEELRRRVYLMPQAATQAELMETQKAAILLAQEFGVNVTTRLQVLAWGTERRR